MPYDWSWSDRGWAYAQNDQTQPRDRRGHAVVFRQPFFQLTYNKSPFENVDIQKVFRSKGFNLVTRARFNHKQKTLGYAGSLQVSTPGL